MRRAYLIAIVLLGCERASEQPTPPPPRDAQIDAPGDARVDPARIEALDRLYTYFATTPRKRSPVEANEQLTHAYREWIFAYGYARAGKPARTAELVMTAKSRLEHVPDDPVHAALASAYAARVTAALAGKPATESLPAGVESQLALLDRVERYKVDRLRESSRVLGPPEVVDAIGAFSRRIKDARGADFDKLQGVVDPDERAKILSQILENAAKVEEDERVNLLDGALAEAERMPAGLAKRVLATAIAQIELAPAAKRGRVYARAIAVAAMSDLARLPQLVEQAGPALVQLVDWELARALEVLVRSIGRTHRTELAAIWKQLEAKALDTKQKPDDAVPRLRAAYAAGLVQLGDPRAKEMLAAIEKAGDSRSISYRLELSRTLVLAYAQLPSDEALAAIERVARQFPSISDSFSTNSHYAKSVLELMDTVVVGVVDE
ncbi:MAG: hypothetical protein M4D80_29495 [Myxococcota bacterium]|nr:hypothetical protein [Myxococcota bacterium]